MIRKTQRECAINLLERIVSGMPPEIFTLLREDDKDTRFVIAKTLRAIAHGLYDEEKSGRGFRVDPAGQYPDQPVEKRNKAQ